MARWQRAIWMPLPWDGGDYVADAPFKIVHHTTGGSTAEGAFGTYQQTHSIPHFTVDAAHIYQHLDTGIAARALRHTGSVETNRSSAIQFELVGFAGRPKDRAALTNAGLLCRWIEATHGVTPVWPSGYPNPPQNGGDPGHHNRSVENWTTRSGHYGHSHVPDNVHWDPAYTKDEADFVMAVGLAAPQLAPAQGVGWRAAPARPQQVGAYFQLASPAPAIGPQPSLPQPYFKRPTQGVFAQAAAAPMKWTVGDLCRAYDWPSNLGGGGVIAIVELGGGYVPSDIAAFFAANGQPVPAITDVPVNGGVNAPNQHIGDPRDPDIEVAMDIEIAGAAYFAATGKPATIRVYWAPGDQPGSLAAAIRTATADGCDVCSISWGSDEDNWRSWGQPIGQDLLQDQEAAAQAATAAGMIVFAATGDNDSGDGGPTPANVDAPSSCPHIIACGGTSKTRSSETVWNNDPGNTSGEGTGGGFSTAFPPQAFQAGAPMGPGRMIPDVSANADPNTGYQIVVHGQTITSGGTSAVAPLYAGLFAAFGRKLGFVTPTLWKNHLCFNDIVDGDNGAFRARIGPDACTGIGSPVGVKVAALFTQQAPAIARAASRQALLQFQLNTEASIAAELAARTQAHQAAMAGLRIARAQAAGAAAPAPSPLILLAHGDSWFDYPLTGNGLPITPTDIIAQFGKVGRPAPVILNMSHYGDATTTELSLPKQQRLRDSLQDPANWRASGKPDAILFSGGGDDIAGDQFCICLDYAAVGSTGLNLTRFADVLGSVMASYLDLFAFRDRYAPGVPIVGHCYDFPIPSGVHPLCAGPWLKPSLDFCGWDVEQGTAIVRVALTRFREMLLGLANDRSNNFVLADTQGTLMASEWANELHPDPAGFAKIAGVLAAALRSKFPGRI